MIDETFSDAAGSRSTPTAELNRRRFLSHVAWAGSALVFTSSGGVLSGCSSASSAKKSKATDLTFAQISDTHIGFTGPANPDVAATAAAAIAQINAMTTPPAFVVHTGDITHTSTPDQFDKAKQLMSTLTSTHVVYVPGEHDATDDNGEKYRTAFGAGTQGDGWSSFDVNGVHFVALVNTLHLDKLGHLGQAQIDFVKADLAKLSSETPIVFFSHIPLFAMFPNWGWGTDDAAQVLGLAKRFGSVTAVNGHVHQLMTKVEGNVTFYAGRCTAYPLPAPGEGGAPAAKPLTVAADKLRTVLGTRQIHYAANTRKIDVQDHALA